MMDSWQQYVNLWGNLHRLTSFFFITEIDQSKRQEVTRSICHLKVMAKCLQTTFQR